MTTLTLVDKLKAARRASVPLVSISTPDPGATQSLICGGINGKAIVPKLSWDAVSGLVPLNDDGHTALAEAAAQENTTPEDLAQSTKQYPVRALVVCRHLPQDSIVFLHNVHKFFEQGDLCVIQAVWNLRDQFKTDFRMAIILGPDIPLPPELKNDVVHFDEPYPDDEQLQAIVGDLLLSKQDDCDYEVTQELIKDVSQRLKGCASFAAEQLTAMAMSKAEVSTEQLDTQAKHIIEQTPGLSFESATETFDNIGGLQFAKEFGRRLFSGPRAPAVVVRIEELEKAMAGAKGDLSGTSGDALQVLLSELEDNNWSGMLVYGPPGGGKSLYAKALANSHGARAMRCDINATKSSLVGSSEKRVREAMKVIKTLGGDRVFFVASVNRMDNLPPELQRRFRAGVWMFDLPSEEERLDIWRINLAQYGLDDEPIDEADLTGADIRNICDMAATLQCTLEEARKYVVPLKVSGQDAIQEARSAADGRFLSAAEGGVYRKPSGLRTASGRKVKV